MIGIEGLNIAAKRNHDLSIMALFNRAQCLDKVNDVLPVHIVTGGMGHQPVEGISLVVIDMDAIYLM